MGLNNGVNYPCKGCTKRSKPDEPNCHGYCEEYLAAQLKAKEINKRMYEHKTFVSTVDYFRRANV